MAINESDIYKEEIESKGGVNVDTPITGEITGTIANGTKLSELRGVPISNNVIQEYQGLVRFDGELKPTGIVYTTRPTTGGNVQGDFDDGLNLKSIYGSSLVNGEQFDENGQGIVYRGGELYATQLNPYRKLNVTTSLTETEVGDVLSIDCTLPNIEIPLPASAQASDKVFFSIYKGDPTIADHAPRFTGTLVAGDDDFYVDRKAGGYLVFDGTDWSPKQ